MATQDRHLTAEQLSALLDDALSAQERVSCEVHLRTCEQCQQELAELRQTVALLHALPQPALPRSFVLSADVMKLLIPTANDAAASSSAQAVGKQDAAPTGDAHAVEEPRILPFPAARRTRPGFVYTTMRFASSIAAVLGLILLTASLFSVMPHSMGMPTSTAGSASSTSSGAAEPATAPNGSKNTSNAGGTAVANNQDGTPGSVRTPAIQPQATQVPRITSPDHNSPVTAPPFTLPDLTTPGGEALLGIVLLVLGIVGLLVLRWRRNRDARAPN